MLFQAPNFIIINNFTVLVTFKAKFSEVIYISVTYFIFYIYDLPIKIFEMRPQQYSPKREKTHTGKEVVST